MMPEECANEMKTKDHTLTYSLLVTTEHHGIGEIIDCDKFNSFQKLLRVTAYVKKIILKFRSLVTDKQAPVVLTLTSEDIERAETDWVIECQRHLTKDNKFDLWKHQLDLFLDQYKIWRCGGRLNKANTPYSSKHPILLYKQHRLAILITEYAHKRTMHGGVKETLTKIRAKYWFVKGRQFVRKIIYRCVTCRRSEVPHYKVVPEPPLPEFRVQEAPPFAYCGVDFAGPLYVKVNESSEHNKVWICLYTCCVTRAVHLELLPDMTAQMFLRAFKRFTARRRIPLKMISDNGKTFIAAAQAIDSMLTSTDVQQYFAGLKVKWVFTLEKAPWWGGFYERMIQSMKRCLKKTIGKAKLTHDELFTALTEVEGIINSRPLSYVSSNDLEEPLTPAHLLTGRRILSLPDTAVSTGSDGDNNFEVSSEELHARVHNLNSALTDFWNRWRQEYLLQLRERYSSRSNSGVPRAPIQSKIVLVHDENHPRTMWRLGRVNEVITSSDGNVQGASIEVKTNNKLYTIRQPISHLYPLEAEPNINLEDKRPSVNGDDFAIDKQMSTQPDEATPDHQPGQNRPVRTAALRAREQVQSWMDKLTDSM